MNKCSDSKTAEIKYNTTENNNQANMKTIPEGESPARTISVDVSQRMTAQDNHNTKQRKHVVIMEMHFLTENAIMPGPWEGMPQLWESWPLCKILQIGSERSQKCHEG